MFHRQNEGGYGDMTYMSIGLGRQSTAMGLLALDGQLPRPDYFVFADTGDEIAATYKHLRVMQGIAKDFGMPFYVVQEGVLSDELLDPNGTRSFIPAFVKNPDSAVSAPLHRKCTEEFKGKPIEEKARELLGYKKGGRIKEKVGAYIGISLDEADRMKPSPRPWVTRLYPLIDARLRVEDCERVCLDHLGYIPPKSACRHCPYRSNASWLKLKTEEPEEFEKAAKVDDGIRDLKRAGVKFPAFLHRSCVPLREIDFETLVHGDKRQLNLFTNECEGMCGV